MHGNHSKGILILKVYKNVQIKAKKIHIHTYMLRKPEIFVREKIKAF
jgi:hypothetical protein